MNWFRFVIFILCLAVLQAGMMDLFAVRDVKPDLLLIGMVFFAIFADTNEAIIASFVLGFTSDLIQTAAPMGPGIITFTIFGSILAYLNRYISIRKMPYQGLTIFFISFIVGYLSYLLCLFKDQPAVEGIFWYLLWTSFYSAIVGPFLFLPYSWWMQYKLDRYSKVR